MKRNADIGLFTKPSNFNDPVDYSKSLLVKQASARAKELVIERQIISIKQQIELSCHEEEEAVLEENKQFARLAH